MAKQNDCLYEHGLHLDDDRGALPRRILPPQDVRVPELSHRRLHREREQDDDGRGAAYRNAHAGQRGAAHARPELHAQPPSEGQRDHKLAHSC